MAILSQLVMHDYFIIPLTGSTVVHEVPRIGFSNRKSSYSPLFIIDLTPYKGITVG